MVGSNLGFGEPRTIAAEWARAYLSPKWHRGSHIGAIAAMRDGGTTLEDVEDGWTGRGGRDAHDVERWKEAESKPARGEVNLPWRWRCEVATRFCFRPSRKHLLQEKKQTTKDSTKSLLTSTKQEKCESNNESNKCLLYIGISALLVIL